ncbi:LysR family transcriptional regulator [Xanthobacter dioxanivorans]|uniref:LysR family transcriptional regulator n=1 Tax=Xanthobacter dioxanivorans TaxID=2528964 RepID=A0A974PJD2_9HYPH|nr:LysR substrate-binding domain-containing protein [Xanthobacter dioxanivorans]QRG04695.1 LysR family transcriptional regulator [Xanthobacter dioxanivorans]
MSRTLEIGLLRTFVLLVEEKSVTRVARRLNRTQPAISLQIRRLEEAAGFSLFEPDLRHLKLSRHGEMLLPHARTMLRLDEEARLRLSADDVAGRVTLGCPDLYAAFLLPQTLARFRASYPGVEVTVRCALSRQLAQDMGEGLLDIAIATRMPGVAPRVGTGTLLRPEPLIWLGAAGGVAHLADPLPLAMLPDGNLYRDYALAALDRIGRRWRIACISESIAGLQSMALADAAVCVLAQSVRASGLSRLGNAEGLPPLQGVDLILWERHPGGSPAADHLAAHIRRNVSEKE